MIGADLRRLPPFELLRALERQLRGAPGDHGRPAGSAPLAWTGLAFRLRDQRLLVPGDEIREVTGRPRLTRVPGARDWLLGVANVRGSALPVTDLGALLDGGPAGEAREQRLLVLQQDGPPAAFLVDDVIGYRRFVPEDQRPSITAAPALQPWRLGAFHRDGQDWLVLSLKRLARSDLFIRAGR
ncbi:chemotaxis protein CheW [Nevskia sp.]|uniref:chemotaxis protein CheW n=1 Tax=Nevskia sp. TaxID=1929292 RepID=UPI003F710159